MKKSLIISGLVVGMGINALIKAQTDTAYLVMKVNNIILDCPHFQGLFKKMEAKNKWKEIERNYEERYLIYAYPANVDYDVISKFKEELNNMHFPMGVVVSIYTKNNLADIKKGLMNE